MSLRPAVRTLAATTLALILIGLVTPPTAGGELATGPAGLPFCPAGEPESTAAPTAPVRLPSLDDPTACQAEPTSVEPVDADRLPTPRPGYHHLGVTTVDGWSGVAGRLAVRNPAVRRDSLDFVATRFMAKHRTGNDQVSWLEVGWAETGWSGDGAQRIYTFDSSARAWTFFDEYRIGDGDRVWVYLHRDTGAGEARWRAWLWWGERWHLLAEPELPMKGDAQLEQYVEVHLDRQARGGPVSVPPIRVDNVRVQSRPGGRLDDWHPERVPTVTPLVPSDYCLEWEIQYHAWSAGDCTVQG